MNTLKNCPRVLFQKILFTALIGAGCFVVGLALYIFSKDRITLLLSGAVLVLSLVKSASLFLAVRKGSYETVEGTCVGVSAKPFRKQFTVKVMDDDGLESALRLGKQTKVKIGYRYRFYFSGGHSSRTTIGSEYLDAALSSGQFLGFEELGEFGKQMENTDAQ